MSLELLFFIYEKLVRIGKNLMARFSKRIVENQLQHLKMNLRNVTIFENKDTEIGRMGRLTISCKNESDIPFQVKGIAADVNVKAEYTPTRKRLNFYPVAKFNEDIEVMQEKKIGHSYIDFPKVGKHGGRNYANISIEFPCPSWLENIERIYVRGFLKVQKEVTKKFENWVSEDEISKES